ncbi:MAG: SGNH/GDSL hydrolase family protein [Ktedonobacteraceae bacterium]|nr:SGNH/GDSL hydrolase family protein [Ktedonobacteraceae bacterium]
MFNSIFCVFSLALMFFLVACSPFPNEGVKNFTLQQAPKARLTYVAIGASDTFGYGTEDPATQSWPFDLAHRLGSDVHLVNLGIPGIDVHQALDLELPVALDAHPDLVTVWLAVNDLVDKVPLKSYREDLDTLFTRLQTAAPHARIVVANVPDLTFVPRFRTTDQAALRKQVSDYNSVITDLVQSHHVILIDLYTQWQALATHPEYISADGFHPSALGYAQLAEIFYQTLRT